MVTYSIENDTFTDFGSQALSDRDEDGTYGYGTGIFYSQLHDTLFRIGYSGQHIHVYDLQSLSYDVLDEPIPTAVSYGACLASGDSPSRRLYVTGGIEYIDYWTSTAMSNLQILELNTTEWTDGVDMTYARQQHGCIVVNDWLWTIGTSTHFERVNTVDIYSATEWETMGYIDEKYLRSFGIVAVGDFIYVIGGYLSDCKCVKNIMYIIDTNDGNVQSVPMNFSVYGMAVVAVNDIIYGFGGAHEYGVATSGWAQYNLLSGLLFGKIQIHTVCT